MKWIKMFEKFKNEQEVAIIGGGIASLYCAYLVKKIYPEIKCTVYEKDQEIGGRVKMSKIQNVEIPTGAQFIRIGKDKRVIELLKDLDINLVPYELKIKHHNFETPDIDKLLKKLSKESKKFDRHKMNFKRFAKQVLADDFDKFVDYMGYTDYLNLDLQDTIDNYGLDDNVPGYLVADVDWNSVIDRLTKKIGKNNIKTGIEIKKIDTNSSGFILNGKYSCNKIIIGVTINCLKKLLDNKIYQEIQSQNFIKVFAKSEDLRINNYTVVKSPIRKILPHKQDVYTIAYSDNQDALNLENKKTEYFEKTLTSEFNRDINLTNVKKFFWEEGTHFYKPLSEDFSSRKEFIKSAQHPQDNIWVIGEMVALKQGWVNGALESVHNISFFKNI